MRETHSVINMSHWSDTLIFKIFHIYCSWCILSIKIEQKLLYSEDSNQISTKCMRIIFHFNISLQQLNLKSIQTVNSNKAYICSNILTSNIKLPVGGDRKHFEWTGKVQLICNLLDTKCFKFMNYRMMWHCHKSSSSIVMYKYNTNHVELSQLI